MQSRGRRRHSPANLGIDRLISGAVARFVAAMDVGRQGHVAEPVERYLL